MNRFEPCPSCARHVSASDARCPFCDAAIRHASRPETRLRRASRAQWLALGSAVALFGCSGATTSSGGSGSSGSSEAASEGACTTRSGYFACGGNVCDRSIQVCVETSSLCATPGDLGTVMTGASIARCGPCPSCACVQTALGGSCECREDDAGSVVVSCGGCYGAPPARLERLARTRTAKRRRR